jgi:hypothetical protein
MSKFCIRAAAVITAGWLVLAACSNPAGGDEVPQGSPAIPVSGTVNAETLSDLGLGEEETAVLEFYTSEGAKIAEAEIASDGTWTASIPSSYQDSEVQVVIVVPTTGDEERVFEAGTITVGEDSPPALTLPDTTVDYDITKTDPTNGSYEVSHETDVFAGEIITITATPEEGYRVKQLDIAKSGGGAVTPSPAGTNTWTFTMPTENVTVTVEFEIIPVVVTAFSLDTLVTAPVKGVSPVTTAIDETQYTGTIAWQTASGAEHSGAFVPSTVYKALVILTAKTGYTFEGVAANRFTYTGAAVTNAANSGTVTITFPATDPDEAVTAFSLNGLVTAPARGASPVTTAIDETQYTGSIEWQTASGAAHSGPFAASTVYKAVVTLTAKEGYTFEGVAANRFTYTGAEVTNAANSGTVTITFPATADLDPNTGIPIGDPSVKLYLDGGTEPLTHNGSTDIDQGAGIYTVSIDAGSYTSIVWYLNNNPQTQAQGKTSLVLSKRTAGTYLVTVEAQAVGKPKNSGAHTFVVE